MSCFRSVINRPGGKPRNSCKEEEEFRKKMAFSIQLPHIMEKDDSIDISGRVREPLQVFSINLTLGPRFKAVGYHLKIDYEKMQIIHDWRNSAEWQGAVIGDLNELNMGNSREFGFKLIFGYDHVQVYEEGGSHLHTHDLKVGLKNIKFLEVWEDSRQSNNNLIDIEKLNFTFAPRG